MNKYAFILILVLGFCSLPDLKGQKYAEMAGHSTKVILGGISGQQKSTFEKNVKLFLDGINMAYRNKTVPTFPAGLASAGMDSIMRELWAVSSFFSVNTEVVENVLSTSQGNYEIRNLQIVFEEARQEFQQQDALILLDKNGTVIDFKMALGLHSISTILRNPVNVTDLRRREMIVSFVEDFRTAYNLKDVAFLDNVFSDKALIITGKVITRTVDGELVPNVEYKKQTKAEYLANIKIIFARSKMLNIRFDSVAVVQHPSRPEFYGVTLTQTWNSESYSGSQYNDVGYVFLIIDFSNEARPKIWVRTWQDKKYIDQDHGVFSFNHFNIK